MTKSASLDRLKLPHTIPEVLLRFAHSDQTALICGSEEISYRELLLSTRHIACVLLERGIEKGDRIVLDMHRSSDYVRMCLGVIFAGGVRVTLHAGWPARQREMVLSDCAPALVVNDETAREICSARVSGEKTERPLPKLEGSDPFRLIYTSGSTDTPKGVLNCHALAVGALLAGEDPEDRPPLIRHFLADCSRMLMDADLAFSVADVQLLLALMNQKTLVLASDDEMKTPKALAACMKRTGADAMYGVFSRYYRYLEEPDFCSAIAGFKLIVLTGEKADPKVIEAVQKVSGAVICVVYGSSETLGTLNCLCRGSDQILYEPYTRMSPVFVLKKEGLFEALPGEDGELCVGGPAGMYGRYWNDPELTAKKYHDHPAFGRLLRTGDAARRLGDGRVQISGRMDSMMKLHGQRIEPDAIEAAMEAFPGIRRAAVKIQGEGASAVLCGYYSPVTVPARVQPYLGQEADLKNDRTVKNEEVSGDGLHQDVSGDGLHQEANGDDSHHEAGCSPNTVDQGALRRHLAETLPYYMVPALLRELPQLPLNANGKLDRRALPPIQNTVGEYVPPETETEKLLCDVFEQVLQGQRVQRTDSRGGMPAGTLAAIRTTIPADTSAGMCKATPTAASKTVSSDAIVGAEDSFFELGGDSVRALAVGALLREHGYEMRVEWLFAAPTPRMLSPMLLPLETEESNEPLWSAELSDAEWKIVESVTPGDNVEAVYPILPGMRDYCRRQDPCWLCSAFLMDEGFTMEILQARLDASVRCHQALRTVITQHQPLQVVLREWTTPVFFVDLRRLQADDGREFSDAQIRYLTSLRGIYQAKPFASREVMFEAGLVQVSENRCVLFLACSHLLLDATGFIRIKQELAGGAPAVSDVRPYNRYMRRLLGTAYAQEGRIVWQDVFAKHQGFSSLPSVPGKAASRMKLFVAGDAFAKKAGLLCAKNRVTTTALVCLAMGRVLMKLCNTPESGFFTTTNGRDEKNQRLTGMFTGILPVWVTKEDTPSSLQEQLVRAVSVPLPDLDSFAPEGEQMIPDHGVFLSMQNHLNMEETRDLFQSELFTAQMRSFASDTPAASIAPAVPAASSASTGSAPSVASAASGRRSIAPKRMAVHVDPGASFRITVLYNEAWFDGSIADSLGRGILTELRRLVDEAFL